MEAILDAAAQVFEARGYGAGTTNRIAARAGVSIGTLYQYFANKEDLAVALLERHIQDTLRRMREWVGHMVAENHSLHDALEDYITGIMEIHGDRPTLQHLLLEETPLPEAVHRRLLEAEFQSVRTLAGLLRTFPEMARPNLEHAAYLVLHAVEALVHRSAAHPMDTTISRDGLRRELLVMLEAYLRSGEPVPGPVGGEGRRPGPGPG